MKRVPPLLAFLAFAACWLHPAASRAGDAGYAIQLDGIHGYLGCDLPGAIRDCGSITLSAWILPAGPAGELTSPEPRGQAAVGLGFHFGLSAGKIFCAKGTGAGGYVVLVGATSMAVGAWHHVAATFDGTVMRVYLDGLLDGVRSDASPIDWADLPEVFPPGQSNYPSPAQLFIGADKHNDLGGGATIPDFAFYEGDIDEVQIWNRALSQDEIDLYRRISLTGTEPGLVDYWKFDEGSGFIATDQVAAAGDLALYPGATWIPSTAPVNVTGVGPLDARSGSRLTAYPNPARAGTKILLECSATGTANFSVFDLSGRQIARPWEGRVTAGRPLEISWDGRDQAGRRLPNGVYLVRFDSQGARLTTRIMILR